MRAGRTGPLRRHRLLLEPADARRQPVTYSTLLVHLDCCHANDTALALTAKLADQFKAKVIGIAACQPMQIGTAGGDFTGSLAVLERDIVDDELKRAASEFHAHAALLPFILEWRSIETLSPVSHTVADEARCADLLITGLCSDASRNALTHADTGDLIVRAGRPVLVVPDKQAPNNFETVVIAWADTRECRRAVTDALPILKLADRVIVAEMSSERAEARSHIKDVAAWLSRHSVSAEAVVGASYGDPSGAFAQIAKDRDADLIVAGAYGHNRLREWAFGGMTRDLLLRLDICALLSH
jgi:nucleotide-binding universal stress UspA family protein